MMMEVLDNKLKEISIINQGSMNESSCDSFILNNEPLFSNNNRNNNVNDGKNMKRKKIKSINSNVPKNKLEYYQTTPVHKKTISTNVFSAQQFASRIQSKMKLFSPIISKQVSPKKEIIYGIINTIQMPSKINQIIQRIQSKTGNTLLGIQKEFANQLDVLYIDNLKRIKEVNEKYNYDLYKSLSDTNNTSSSNEKYNQLLSEKNSELSEIENEFLIKKNTLLLNFNTKMCFIREEVIKQINNQRNTIKDEIILTVNNKLNPKIKIISAKQLSNCNSAKKGVVSFKRTWKI